jgi:hypothetical protein
MDPGAVSPLRLLSPPASTDSSGTGWWKSTATTCKTTTRTAKDTLSDNIASIGSNWWPRSTHSAATESVEIELKALKPRVEVKTVLGVVVVVKTGSKAGDLRKGESNQASSIDKAQLCREIWVAY